MDYDSPLRFLDRDVSRMIYEIYSPSDRSKEWKNMLNDQYKYHCKRYLYYHKLTNIYDLCKNRRFVTQNIYNNVVYTHYKLGTFLTFLTEQCKFKTLRIKIKKEQHIRNSWQRAKQYKWEAISLKYKCSKKILYSSSFEKLSN